MASECSSGCESGWTNYLEQSFLSANPSHKGHEFNDRKSGFCDELRDNRGRKEVDDDDDFIVKEEDLSMISDASSGPPHFYEDNGYFNDDNKYQYTVSKGATLNKNGGNRHRSKEHRRHREDIHELPSFLDDTASSPLINFSKNNFAQNNNQASMESVFDYSQGFSTTHFHGGPAFQDHFGFLQSSPPGNQLQNNQLSGFKERERRGNGTR
ncbi:hypothetical protein DITRI_Ditri08aG0100300 [Diplodiscus trichospermus]